MDYSVPLVGILQLLFFHPSAYSVFNLTGRVMSICLFPAVNMITLCYKGMELKCFACEQYCEFYKWEHLAKLETRNLIYVSDSWSCAHMALSS